PPPSSFAFGYGGRSPSPASRGRSEAGRSCCSPPPRGGGVGGRPARGPAGGGGGPAGGGGRGGGGRKATATALVTPVETPREAEAPAPLGRRGGADRGDLRPVRGGQPRSAHRAGLRFALHLAGGRGAVGPGDRQVGEQGHRAALQGGRYAGEDAGA